MVVKHGCDPSRRSVLLVPQVFDSDVPDFSILRRMKRDHLAPVGTRFRSADSLDLRYKRIYAKCRRNVRLVGKSHG